MGEQEGFFYGRNREETIALKTWILKTRLGAVFCVVQNIATETESSRQIAKKKLKSSPSHFHMPLND